MTPETVLLGLGTNLGDRLETLIAAVYALDDVPGLAVEDVSGVYETPPWPPPDDPRAVSQEPFFNLVVRGVSSREPHALLNETQMLERAFGRDRETETRWGPRTLDIDLLMFGQRTMQTPELVLPHPRMAERAFVLIPLLEVLPGGALPDGRRVTRMLNELAPIEGIELVVRLDEVGDRHAARPRGPDAPPPSFTRPGDDGSDDPARGERR